MMRNNTQDKPLRQRLEKGTLRDAPGTRASLWARLTRYRKITFAVLVALLVLFVVQNGGGTDVRFLLWEIDMPQAVLIAGALLLGGLVGAVLARQRLRVQAPR